MSQDNMFTNNGGASFHQGFESVYHQDIPVSQLQFAATVPPTNNRRQSMSFGNGFQNQDVLMQQHAAATNFSLNYPGSPYERPNSDSCVTQTKQLQSKAERRAEHNAIERARRESLNVKFQQLAFTLPNLQNDSRPSKSTIIDRTLDFVKGAILKEDRMQYRIQELEKFNRYLLAELDKKSGDASVETKEMLKQQAELQQEQQKEQAQNVTAHSSPTMMNNASPTASIMSEDSEVDLMIKSSSSPPPPPPSTTTRKRNSTTSMTNRRNHPVSRSTVPMIPKLEYATMPTSGSTNWPTTQVLVEKDPHQMMMSPQQNIFSQQQQFEAQQQFFTQQQQQKFYNHDPSLNNDFMINHTNIYDPTNTQHMIPSTTSYFNQEPLQHSHHHLQQHRR